MLQSEVIYAVMIFIGGILAAFIVHFLLNSLVRRVFEKTKTRLDDEIFDIISKPIFGYIIVIGLYLGVKSLPAVDPHINTVDGVFFVLSALVVAHLINRVLVVLVESWLTVKKQEDKTPQLIKKIITVTVYSVALIIVLGNFGVQIGPLIAALGVGGLAVGLALKDTLSNIFSGVYIISDKPARVGDYVELQKGTIAGYIQDIGWRTTRIKTRRNDIVIIPNTQLAESVITNYNLKDKKSEFTVSAGVAYDSDLKQVEKITLEVAKKIQETARGAAKSYKPAVRFREFGDSNINFSAILMAEDYTQKGRITHEFIKALKKRFDKEGIEISFPVRKIIQDK